MNFESIAKYGLFFFFFLGMYFYMSRKLYSLFALLIISFGMNAFTALAGTLWFPYKVVMFATTLYALNTGTIPFVKDTLQGYYVTLFISVLTAWIFTPNIAGVTFLQGPTMRPIVQLYTYVTMALLVPFIVNIINTKERLEWSYKVYMRLSEIIIFIGLLHFVFIILGMEFLPILRPGGKESEFAAFGFEETSINRIYGISGEPKSLATFILPYIFISLYNYIERNYNVSKTYHIFTLITSFIIMIYTFSSAILISAGIGIIVIPMLFKHSIGSRILNYAIMVGIVFFVFTQSGSSFIQNNSKSKNNESISFMDVLYERSLGRVEKEKNERYETVALNDIIYTEPEFLITGFGLGMYNYHLPMPKHSRGIEPIDSGWIVILLDMGFIGLIYFLSLFQRLIKLKNTNKYYNDIIFNSYLIGAFIGFLAHLGNNALYQIFLFTGLSIAAWNVITKEDKMMNVS